MQNGRPKASRAVTLHKTTQLPISVGHAQKREVRTQFAALCYRVVKDKPQVLLVSSRDSKRWIVPKGWPMDGKTPAEAAALEAWEEAGVEGRVQDFVLGIYSYDKIMSGDHALPCVVAVFPLKVKRLAPEFPEANERNRKWFSLKVAATKVREPELAHVIAKFDPSKLR